MIPARLPLAMIEYLEELSVKNVRVTTSGKGKRTPSNVNITNPSPPKIVGRWNAGKQIAKPLHQAPCKILWFLNISEVLGSA